MKRLTDDDYLAELPDEVAARVGGEVARLDGDRYELNAGAYAANLRRRGMWQQERMGHDGGRKPREVECVETGQRWASSNGAAVALRVSRTRLENALTSGAAIDGMTYRRLA